MGEGEQEVMTSPEGWGGGTLCAERYGCKKW